MGFFSRWFSSPSSVVIPNCFCSRTFQYDLNKKKSVTGKSNQHLLRRVVLLIIGQELNELLIEGLHENYIIV